MDGAKQGDGGEATDGSVAQPDGRASNERADLAAEFLDLVARASEAASRERRRAAAAAPWRRPGRARPGRSRGGPGSRPCGASFT